MSQIMTTFPDDVVEAAARAIYETLHAGLKNCHSWDDSSLDDEYPGKREYYFKCARAALSAVAPYISQREAAALERAAAEMVRLKEKCPNSYSGQTMLMAYDYAETAIRALKQKHPDDAGREG